MRIGSSLFSGDYLDDRLRLILSGIEGKVRGIPDDVFLNSNDDDITKSIIEFFRVDPIFLKEDERKRNAEMIQMDMSHDTQNFFPDPFGRPNIQDGNRVDFVVPFSGAEWVFYCMPRCHPMAPPVAEILSDALKISFEIPNFREDDSESRYEQEMMQIRLLVKKANDILQEHNDSLSELIGQEVAKHRLRLDRNRAMS